MDEEAKKIIRYSPLVLLAVLLIALFDCEWLTPRRQKINQVKEAMSWMARQKDTCALRTLDSANLKRLAQELKSNVHYSISDIAMDYNQDRLDSLNQDMARLRRQATPQYALGNVFSTPELKRINEYIHRRALHAYAYNQDYPFDNVFSAQGLDCNGMRDLVDYNALVDYGFGDLVEDWWYMRVCDYVINNPLDADSGHMDDLIYIVDALYYLEKRPDMTSYRDFNKRTYMDTLKIPNRNPLITVGNGQIMFTIPAVQKLYEQYKQDRALGMDSLYIWNNPQYASKYCALQRALIEAYRERDKLHSVGLLFDNHINRLNEKKHELSVPVL